MAHTVQVNITLAEEDNRVLNVVKASYGLRDKAEAASKVIGWYRQELAKREIQREVANEPAWLDGEIKPEVAAAILRDTDEYLKRGVKPMKASELRALFDIE